MRITETARKHGVADEDMQHAASHAIALTPLDDDLTMLAGPATNGTLLEIGVLDLDGDDPVIVHAMPCRPKFLP